MNEQGKPVELRPVIYSVWNIDGQSRDDKAMKHGMGMMALALLAGPVAAQTPPAAPVCTTPAPPPPELAGWHRAVPITAGDAAARAPLLVPGVAARVALLPSARVGYAVPPAKAGDAASLGGVLALDVARAGTYRIALGVGAWLDVVGPQGAVPSAGHGHGPDCSGIRKMVDFPLTPGRYLLQIAASGAPEITVMVVALK